MFKIIFNLHFTFHTNNSFKGCPAKLSNKEHSKDALIYIAGKDLIHGDIKPGNILVSNRDFRLRAFLGDFGLTEKSGGTPIFMAPEGLSKNARIVGKTDMYSFAVTVLFLMFPADLAMKLLFLPITENWEKCQNSLSDFPLLLWILNSLCSNPEGRADFDSWKVIIEEIKTFDKIWLAGRIKSEILEENGVDLSPLSDVFENEGGVYFYILDNFRHDIRSSQVNQNDAYKMSTAISQIQNLSLLKSKVELGLISKGKFVSGDPLGPASYKECVCALRSAGM